MGRMVLLSLLVWLCALPELEAQVRRAVRTDPKAELEARVEALRPELVRLSDELWRYAETALREERSAALLAQVLEQAGFQVQRGVADMPGLRGQLWKWTTHHRHSGRIRRLTRGG